MKSALKLLLLISLLVVATSASLAQYQYPPPKPSQRILTFSTMVGVSGVFLGPYQIRGVIGDGLPWVSGRIKGTLFSDGRLNLRVRGLVFPNDPAVPLELRGINDEPTFRAIVSCLSDDGAGGVTTMNVSTAEFPATVSGNATILESMQLPNPCVAPMIFVVGGADQRWFAMTGAKASSY